jgi:hypothetical protein
MERREFITLLGSGAAFPLAVRAQQTMPVIGFLSPGSPAAFQPFVVAFRQGLAEIGFVEGRVAIERRWAEGQNDRLPALADDLVRARVTTIVAGGPRWRRRPPQPRYLSYPPAVRTPSSWAWLQATAGRAAMSRASLC